MPVKKENLFQSEGFRSVRAAILTIVIGMLFGLVVLLLVTTPQNAFGAFRELITGGFLSMGLNNGIGRMLFCINSKHTRPFPAMMLSQTEVFCK